MRIVGERRCSAAPSAIPSNCAGRNGFVARGALKASMSQRGMSIARERSFDASSWFDEEGFGREDDANRSRTSRPGTRGSRPNTRGASRPGTRNTNRSSSRASTPQLVEPLRPVTPQHAAAAASLIAFQIRHIGSRESRRKGTPSPPRAADEVEIPPLTLPSIDLKMKKVSAGENIDVDAQKRVKRKRYIKTKRRRKRMKRLKVLQSGIEFNHASLYNMIKTGITAETTADEIRDMVEDKIDNAVRSNAREQWISQRKRKKIRLLSPHIEMTQVV